MSHQETYHQNEAYAEFLTGWDESFYAKYADALQISPAGAKILDAGCGVGQVLARLRRSGFDAYGVDVSTPNIERARKVTPNCQVYDGRRLPFPDGYFAVAGAFNVLEHVEKPEPFITELVRVVQPGGGVVISSPNFFRVLGFRDYHPRMRGVRNKWRNFWRLWEKRRQIQSAAGQVQFDRLQPIIRTPFQPDDDAIIATNGVEIGFFLEQAGCLVESVVCTDRYVPAWLDVLLNFTPLRFAMFNAFVRARKRSSDNFS